MVVPHGKPCLQAHLPAHSSCLMACSTPVKDCTCPLCQDLQKGWSGLTGTEWVAGTTPWYPYKGQDTPTSHGHMSEEICAQG